MVEADRNITSIADSLNKKNMYVIQCKQIAMYAFKNFSHVIYWHIENASNL